VDVLKRHAIIPPFLDKSYKGKKSFYNATNNLQYQSLLILAISLCENIGSQDNWPYNHLKHGSEVCDGTTNQTNRLSHQQRQNSTVNIFNIQLYTFIITFGKHKFIQKIKKWRQEYKNTKYDHDKLYDLRTGRIKLMNWIQYNKLLNKKIKTLKLNESFITV
jgi:hypothetical protein